MEEYITDEELQDYIFHSLIKAGLVPGNGDVEIITDIFIEFLFKKGMVEQ